MVLKISKSITYAPKMHLLNSTIEIKVKPVPDSNPRPTDYLPTLQPTELLGKWSTLVQIKLINKK